MRSLLYGGTALMVATLVAAAGFAQQERDPAVERVQPNETQRAEDHEHEAVASEAIRASQIIGARVENPAGENIGNVDDIVLDAEKGKVRYAALSFGGFLGFGDRLFAVPWEAFEIRRVNGVLMRDFRLVLDITREQLEGQEGFDKDNWPDFADKQFTDRIDRHYENQVRERRENEHQEEAEQHTPDAT